MNVRQLETKEVIPLRALILRPGQPLEASHYPADPKAVHFGLELKSEIVCVVTAHPEASAAVADALNPWRIRGMATHSGFQGHGFGSKVLTALLDWARLEKIDWFWCNARAKAIPFYERHGFETVSELFELPLIGPHKVMRRGVKHLA
jgi:GNAT superfamily N-acetyltransferase